MACSISLALALGDLFFSTSWMNLGDISSTGLILGLMPRLMRCSSIELPHLLACTRDAQRIVLVPLLDLRQQIAEPLDRDLVGVGGGIGQDDVHALEELLQVDLEVRPLLEVLHRLDRLLQDVVGLLGIGDRLLGKPLDLGNAQPDEQIDEPPVAGFQHGNLAR